MAVVRAGGRTVSLGDLLGPQFDAAPERMFGADRFHPSAEGYRVAASVVLPSALAALGLGTRAEPAGAVTPLADAALSAVRRPGTEVSADGRSRARSRLRVSVRDRGPTGNAVPSLSSPAQGE